MIHRHGDLCIKSIEKLPEGLKKLNHNILAQGEVTGHAHTLLGEGFQLYEDDKSTIYFSAAMPVEISHQEHKVKPLEKGFYIVEREVEYCPFEEAIKQTKD